MMLFDKDRWAEIWNVLGKNPLRTGLTAFGVFWGIFMLIVMLGVGSGMERGVTSGFEGMATNSFFTWSSMTSMPYGGAQPGRQVVFKLDDIAKVKSEVPGVQYMLPRNQLGGYRAASNVVRGSESAAFSVQGNPPKLIEVTPIYIKEGRFVNEKDEKENRKICVISTRVKEVMFKDGSDPIGQFLRINGVYFLVVGIFDSKRSADQAERDLNTIHVPFHTFQKVFNSSNEVDWFSFTVKEEYDSKVVEEEAVAALKKAHNVHPNDEFAIGHFNLSEEFNRITGLFKGIEVLIWVVGIGTLLAGVIGVSNIMLIIIRERTNEFGVRRAIGATPVDIIKQVIFESVVLTALSGYLGFVVGVGVIEYIAAATAGMDSGKVMFKNPMVDFEVAIISLTVITFFGALAGVIPARKAVSIKPIDALRTE